MHEGFWACMDTPKDVERLNKLWYEGVLPGTDIVVSKPPWKVWDE
jgi:NDP-sugar pyrophosphorylase family protein